MESEERRIFRLSHILWQRLGSGPAREDDEVIFLDFRPRFLIPQKRVYLALVPSMCAICMNDVYPENAATQHNPCHPAVCRRCYDRVSICPFCRMNLSVGLELYRRLR